MSDAGKFVVDGREYPLASKLTLGEERLLKRMGYRKSLIGISVADLVEDPDLMAGLLLISMRRAGEEVTERDVDQLAGVEFHPHDATPAGGDDADPPPSGDGAASAAPSPDPSQNPAETPPSGGAPN